jgi:hypothetical protein
MSQLVLVAVAIGIGVMIRTMIRDNDDANTVEVQQIKRLRAGTDQLKSEHDNRRLM